MRWREAGNRRKIEMEGGRSKRKVEMEGGRSKKL